MTGRAADGSRAPQFSPGQPVLKTIALEKSHRAASPQSWFEVVRGANGEATGLAELVATARTSGTAVSFCTCRGPSAGAYSFSGFRLFQPRNHTLWPCLRRQLPHEKNQQFTGCFLKGERLSRIGLSRNRLAPSFGLFYRWRTLETMGGVPSPGLRRIVNRERVLH